MGIDTGGVVFRVRVGGKWYAILKSVSWDDPNGVYLQVGEGGGGMRKGPAVWPSVTSFSMFLSMIDGLVLAQEG